MSLSGDIGLLYLSPLGRVTGSLLDTLDYLVAMKRAGLKARLVWMGKRPELAGEVAEDRYEDGVEALGDAEVLGWRWELRKWRFGRVLVPYTTFRRVSWWIHAKETCVLPSQWMRRDAGRPFGWPLTRGRVTYLLDPERHPYKLKGREDYRKKVLLDGLRRPAKSERALLVNCESRHKRHTPERILEEAGPDWRRECIRVLCSGAAAQVYREAGFTVLEPPVKGLFERFSHYLYLPSRTGYDENPRLLIESAWLGKSILTPSQAAFSEQEWQRLRAIKDRPGEMGLHGDDALIERFRSP